ncbi:MAG: caspase family protein, partial [Thiomargarita sp.]|nr:caspase family protein [Thiomargarita sp.]
MKHIILSLLIFAMISVQVLARDKLALVVGNNSYSGMFDSLNNSVNDARKMAEALEDLGFKVILELNASQETIELAIDKFGEKLSKDSVGLFYFSGHAAQYKDVNYLVPTNFIKNSNKLRHRATPVGFVLAEMKTANNGLNIVILDACRNILEEIQDKGYGDAGGLGKMQAISGSVIAYATQPGFKSYEDRTQDNSYYTKHLLRFIKQDGLSLTELFSEVSLAVSKETKGKQEPWTSFLSLPKFCLAGCDGIMPPRNGLAELLKTCQSYMNQDWFTTSPTGQTALNCYQRVLKLDANNRQAFQAFEEMEDYYVDAVVKYLRNNNKRQAEKYLVRLRKVSPESPIIDEFEDQIVVIDSDNDGIADNQDRCAYTPRGTKVKSNGCPVSVDSDNDGIFDAQDRCPNTPR